MFDRIKNNKYSEVLKKNKFLILALGALLPIIAEILIFNFKETFTKLPVDISLSRLAYMYVTYLLIFIYFVLDKFKDTLNRVLTFFMKYRFIIYFVALIILVLCKVNFSSIGIWDSYIPNDEQVNKSTVLGVPRSIRSDEWAVQTPFSLAQAMNADFYPRVNENIAGGQNMLMLYQTTVFDISLLGRPFNWGYILFGMDYGISWFWCLKLILLFVVSYEVALILTKKNPLLSFVGALWLTFSPPMSWWFNSIVDIFIFGEAILIIFSYYLRNNNYSILKKILLGFLMMMSIVSFAFSLYPPLQIPVVYLMIIMMGILNFKYIKNLKKIDFFIMGSSLLLALSILGYFVIVSADDINATMNTVYPGKRFIQGGNITMQNFVYFAFNYLTPYPFEQIPGLNECETSMFIFPFISVFILSIINIKNKKNINDYPLFLGIFIFFIIQTLWLFVKFPYIIAKISLFSFSPEYRSIIVWGMTGVYLCLMMISSKKIKNISGIKAIIYTLSMASLLTYALYHFDYLYIFTKKAYAVMIICTSLITYFFITGNKKGFAYIITIVTIITGMTINPIIIGTGSIYDKQIARELSQIRESNPEATWIASNNLLGQYLVANGVKSLNGVNFTPNSDMIEILDSENKYSDIYNRYAHISVELTENETSFRLNYQDAYTILLNYNDLEKLGVKYMLSREEIVVEDNDIKLIEKYHNSTEMVYIYQFEY